MNGMFEGASAFNQPLSWDTSRVTDMSYMFYSAWSFNQPLSFDLSSVTSMSGMFGGNGASLSITNKVLIRCAWAGNAEFDANYGTAWDDLGACPTVFTDKS